MNSLTRFARWSNSHKRPPRFGAKPSLWLAAWRMSDFGYSLSKEGASQSEMYHGAPASAKADGSLQRPPDTDIFVVGGGPAGLAVAIAASQSGFRVMVADGA